MQLELGQPRPSPQTLRRYQVAALEQCRALIRQLRTRILLVSPTGSGKTTIAAAIINGAAARNNRTLFIAHRKELIDQCSARLDQAGVPHGIIMAKHPRLRPWEMVQVGSVQTLARRELPPAQLLIVDEAHHARANTYQEIVDGYPGAPVLGLTATPWRVDGRGLGELFKDLVVAASPLQLLAEGYLVPMAGFAYDNPDLAGVRDVGSDYNADELELVMDRPRILGNVVEKYVSEAGGSRAVVFAATVKHSQDLIERFRAAGVTAEHLDGETPKVQREAILRRLAAGLTRVVSNVGVLTEGFDCPALTTCILARPTKSLTLYLQMVGRVLRPVCFDCGAPVDPRVAHCPECLGDNIKRGARLHDHAACALRHGLPYMDREYGLDLDARKKKDDAPPPLRQCSFCFAIYDPRTSPRRCPVCGEGPAPGAGQRAIEEVDGQTISLEEVDRRRAQNAKPGHDRFVEYKALLKESGERGYSPGWAAHKYREKYGEFPPFKWRKVLGS